MQINDIDTFFKRKNEVGRQIYSRGSRLSPKIEKWMTKRMNTHEKHI